jgi:ribonuclease PH
MTRLNVIAGAALALVLAGPVAAQEPAAAPVAPKVTLQEVGHALNGMDLAYTELRLAHLQRDSIYRAFAEKVLALPAPTREMTRDELEAALRTARAEAARARGDATPIDDQITTNEARFAEFAAIAKARYQLVLEALDRR